LTKDVSRSFGEPVKVRRLLINSVQKQNQHKLEPLNAQG